MGDVRREILAAAARLTRSPDYDPFKSLSYRQIAAAAGCADATVRYHFKNRDTFNLALVAHMLDPRHAEGSTWNPEDFDGIGTQLTDPTLDLWDQILDVGDFAVRANHNDEILRAQMFLWAHVDNNEYVSELLRTLYKAYERDSEQIVHRFVSEHAGIVERRTDWLNPSEFSIVVTAIMEGLAIRERIEPESISAELPGKVLATLILAMVQFDGWTTGTKEGINKLHRLRSDQPDS